MQREYKGQRKPVFQHALCSKIEHSQPTFTCSKLAMLTPEQGVKYFQS